MLYRIIGPVIFLWILFSIIFIYSLPYINNEQICKNVMINSLTIMCKKDLTGKSFVIKNFYLIFFLIEFIIYSATFIIFVLVIIIILLFATYHYFSSPINIILSLLGKPKENFKYNLIKFFFSLFLILWFILSIIVNYNYQAICKNKSIYLLSLCFYNDSLNDTNFINGFTNISLILLGNIGLIFSILFVILMLIMSILSSLFFGAMFAIGGLILVVYLIYYYLNINSYVSMDRVN
jgi:hypothetical protein